MSALPLVDSHAQLMRTFDALNSLPNFPAPPASLPSFTDTPPSNCCDIALKVILIVGIIFGAALMGISAFMCTPGSFAFIAGIAAGSTILVLSVFAKILFSSMASNARPIRSSSFVITPIPPASSQAITTNATRRTSAVPTVRPTPAAPVPPSVPAAVPTPEVPATPVAPSVPAKV